MFYQLVTFNFIKTCHLLKKFLLQPRPQTLLTRNLCNFFFTKIYIVVKKFNKAILKSDFFR